jgi:hypothetical protein
MSRNNLTSQAALNGRPWQIIAITLILQILLQRISLMIKETWNGCRRCLHQTFFQYNHSGQHGSEMDEWYSQKEMEWWVRATKDKTPGTFSVSSFLCIFK